MSFLAPGFLWLAAAVSAALIVAHLFSRSRPRDSMLPTARFVPEGAVRAPSRARRPSDLMLLVLRMAMALLMGAAFATPVFDVARQSVARVILVDASHAARGPAPAGGSRDAVPGGGPVGGTRSPRAAGMSAVADSITLGEGDVVIAFDTTARRIGSLDSLLAAVPSGAPGSISVALAAGIREAASLATTADSVEIVLLSPIAADEVDSATLALRAAWPGRIRVIRSSLVERTAQRFPVELRAPAGDPLRATLDLLRAESDAEVRMVRGALTPDDSAWVASGPRVLVTWPASRDTPLDSIGAVVAGGQVVVAPFGRGKPPADGRVVARWVDGAAAATEAVHGSGCIRDVAIGIPSASDLALRPELGALVGEIAGPCGGRRAQVPAPDATVTAIAGTGPLAAARSLGGRDASDPRHATWLLIAALMVGLIEHLLRRSRAIRPDERAPVNAAGAMQ